MFDAYKIRKVTLELEYLNNVSSATGNSLMPTTYMVWDQDDAISPPSLLSITSKQGVKVRRMGRGVQRFSVRPVVSDVVGINTPSSVPAFTVAAVSNKSRWIDSLAPAVQHNAIKLAITDVHLPVSTTLDLTQAFRFNWTYHISFRAPLLAS